MIRTTVVAASLAIALAELALSFSCSLPGPAATLCGTADPSELERNVRAASTPPDPELCASVRSMLASIQDQTWHQGRAENQ